MTNQKFRGIGAAFLLLVLGFAVFGAAAGRRAAEPEAESSVTAAEPAETLPVSGEEEELLHRLYLALEKKSYSEAAVLLHDSQEQLKYMLNETLEGERYLYHETEGEEEGASGSAGRHMEELDGDTSGFGLTFTRYNTVFFGEFSDGKPEGHCLALQTVVLGTLRYTFAEGSWKDGRMNGAGTTGYRYCAAVPEGSFAMAEKEGIYVDNLLDGVFTYRTETGNGAVFTWSMEAEMGVTALTEAWSRDLLNGEYKLPAAEDAARTYVLAEEKAEMVMWNNLLPWSE